MQSPIAPYNEPFGIWSLLYVRRKIFDLEQIARYFFSLKKRLGALGKARIIYSVVLWSLSDGKVWFELRGYIINTGIDPSSFQTSILFWPCPEGQGNSNLLVGRISCI
ncbi:MAG: hypothetical protein K9G76_07390 [Bacteroidales bacterium]|nr:hypothetical protein [Bacteroidales bacterium]MCF8405896.1 hypothetical protein [Bacteroidales bacterium]